MPSHRDAANTSVAWKDKTEAPKPDSPPETRYVSSKVTWGTSSNPDGGYSHQHVPKRSHDSVCLLSPTNPTSRAGSLAPRHLHPPPCPGAAETRFYFGCHLPQRSRPQVSKAFWSEWTRTTFPVLTFRCRLQARSGGVLLHEQSPGKGKPESLQVQDQTPHKPAEGTAFPSSFTYMLKSPQPTPSLGSWGPPLLLGHYSLID